MAAYGDGVRRTSWCAAALAAVALLVTGCGSGGTPTQLAVGLGQETRTASAATTAAKKPAKKATKKATTSAQGSGTASVVVRTETLTKPIKYKTVTRRDPDLDKGETRIVRAGARGVLRLTFRVTYTDGERTARTLTDRTVLRAPVNRVVAVGTRVEAPAGQDCHPSYTGACVPIDSDVDCAGGSGNGPSYVAGPVRVVGPDVYDLDRDGDGLACE